MFKVRARPPSLPSLEVPANGKPAVAIRALRCRGPLSGWSVGSISGLHKRQVLRTAGRAVALLTFAQTGATHGSASTNDPKTPESAEKGRESGSDVGCARRLTSSSGLP